MEYYTEYEKQNGCIQYRMVVNVLSSYTHDPVDDWELCLNVIAQPPERV